MIGPFRGGRALAASGVPGQPDTWYFGAVAGGVWKTIDGGNTWQPIFDDQPVASIGALAVAPSDANIVYVGTGEADMRSDISFGSGVYKSTDAGHSWKFLGLADTKQIGRIVIDPHDPNIVLVAALGHAYGPNEQRGIFRSTDGGQTWQKVLFTNDHTGAIDIAADPEDFQIMYAALWNAHRTPWSQYQPVGGPGSGIYKSSDAGVTWTRISGNGLPPGDWGRVGMAVASGKGIKRVYALIDAKKGGGLFRSDDGGENWQLAGSDPRITERAWYFSGVTVDPQNPDIVYLPNVAMYRSTDGGKTFAAFKGAPGGDDYHSLWIDPTNSKRMILASDQGVVVSVDGGGSWSSWYNQPTAQMYHVTTDNQYPYYVYGAQQDSGTVATASRSDYGSITYRDWYPVGAGEAGYIAPDPGDANIVYGGDTYGALFRFDKRTGQSQDISPAVGEDFGAAISLRKLRFTWTSPLIFSPFDSHILYFGSQYLLESTDRGMNWRRISPDLTGASLSSRVPAAESEEVTAANAKARGYGVIYSVAPSPIERGQIWTGSDTGSIYLTKDDGKTWNDVSAKGLGDWSKISMIEASHFDPGTAYAAVDRHRLDDYRPYIFRTRDFGRTWTSVTNGIAAPAYVHAVREDPAKKNLLYAGTETGIYVSFDGGDHWQSLQLNLPAAPVHDLVVKDNDLVAATHGRSFWILDDLTPLRQLTSEIASAEAFLFRPETAIRLRNNNRDTPLPAEFPAGQNPPDGAILDYYIGNEPAGDITLDVLDPHGAIVRHFSSADQYQPPPTPPAFTDSWFRPMLLSKTKGMHRFVWNVRYANPSQIEPQFSIATAFGENTTPSAEGRLAMPGAYEARLTVSGRTFSVPLKIELDPRVKISQAALAGQFDLESQISEAVEKTFAAFQQSLQIREQLKSEDAQISRSADLRTAARTLEQQTTLLAEGPEAAQAEDTVAKPPTLKSLNAKLASELAAVDSADTAPTKEEQEAFSVTAQEVQVAVHAWEKLLADELSAYNGLAGKNGVAAIRAKD